MNHFHHLFHLLYLLFLRLFSRRPTEEEVEEVMRIARLKAARSAQNFRALENLERLGRKVDFYSEGRDHGFNSCMNMPRAIEEQQLILRFQAHFGIRTWRNLYNGFLLQALES